MDFIVSGIAINSIAEELGIVPGDVLMRVNGNDLRDIIDYSYLCSEDNLSMLFRDRNGDEYEVELQKEPDEELGLYFENASFEKKIICKNKCLFCFVDQLPRGMRKSLYLKDDDWRLSFLMGNYITLTNLSGNEVTRIIEQKISPLYVSIHAADDAIRSKLLGCTEAGQSFELLERLVNNGIFVHTQIVMCPEINDGKVLEDTLNQLFQLHPGVASVAVVPVGLTKYREGLCQLENVSPALAAQTIDLIQKKQTQYLQQSGTRFVFASDEMYIKAGYTLPQFEEYEDFSQIENGVGLVRKFLTEVKDALSFYKENAPQRRTFAVTTGKDAYPFLKEAAESIQTQYGVKIAVHSIENSFWGTSVTVAGLLTGRDVIAQLKGKLHADILLMCANCFREGTDVMLDDLSITDIERELGVECRIVSPDGYEYVKQFIIEGDEIKNI